MTEPPPHRYELLGAAAGYDAVTLAKATAQQARNESAGTGPILSLMHLAQLSGTQYDYLRRIVERRSDPYSDFTKAKRSGGRRPISSPEPALLEVQRLILRRSLRNLRLHPRAFAYQRGRSAVDCARLHVGAKWLIKLDLHDFFGSISEARVYSVFHQQGYSELVAFELTRLCTRNSRPGDTLFGSRVTDPWSRYTGIPTYASSTMGALPQGAPTSGALANAVATDLDVELHELANRHGLVYGRYSDDLTFSTSRQFTRARAAAAIGAVTRAVAGHGFVLHHRKTRVVPPRARQVVLGLVLGDTDVLLPREFRRQVEVHIHGAAQGLASHAERRGFETLLGFVSHIDGCLAYAAAVEPSWASDRRLEWTALLRAQGLPV